MQFYLGDTFINIDRRESGIPAHLWIILTDPQRCPAQVLIVNISSYTQDSDLCEDTCILEIGEHPFIKQRSYVVFKRSKITSLEKLILAKQHNLIILNEEASIDLLEKIRRAALTSPNMEERKKKLLLG